MLSIIKYALYCFLVAASIYSQKADFKVVALGGKPEFQKQGSSNWELLKTGLTVSSKDNLKMAEGDYLGLVTSSGKTLEIRNAGQYKCSDLLKSIKQDGSGIQKFAQFVYNESITSAKKSANMTTLGAVVRSRNDMIDNQFPSFTVLNETMLPAVWGKYDNDIKYVFKLMNQDNIALYIQETKDTSLNLDLSKLGLLKGAKYYWYVYNPLKPEVFSDTCTFTLPTNEEKQAITDSVNIFRNTVANGTALDKYLYINFLTAHDLNYEALHEYEKLIQSEPNVEDYTNSFITFLLKQNITKNKILLSNKTEK